MSLILIVSGNKTDLEPLREVPTQTASDYADGIGALLFETSALANVGILDAFAAISRVRVTTEFVSGAVNGFVNIVTRGPVTFRCVLASL